MQIFFTKLRDLSLVRTRFSILCTEVPDETTLRVMFRLISDIADVVISDYNGAIEQEACDKEDIFKEFMPTEEADFDPYMVMYMTIRFRSEDDKNLFIDDFLSSISNY